jgi:putative transposase
VLPANLSDSGAAPSLLEGVIQQHARLEKVWADQGYRGELVEWAREWEDFDLEIVARPDEAQGFVVVRKRWIVERTFAWLGRYRRLSKDYEATCESSEDLIYAAMINRMLHLLHPE